jgi:type I restriction enzyme S subunit
LDVERLTELPLPIPPAALQDAFVERLMQLRAMEAKQAESRRRLDDLFQSLLHRAFRGEL